MHFRASHSLSFSIHGYHILGLNNDFSLSKASMNWNEMRMAHCVWNVRLFLVSKGTNISLSLNSDEEM